MWLQLSGFDEQHQLGPGIVLLDAQPDLVGGNRPLIARYDRLICQRKIIIVLSRRNHGSSWTISQGWSAWQGQGVTACRGPRPDIIIICHRTHVDLIGKFGLKRVKTVLVPSVGISQRPAV